MPPFQPLVLVLMKVASTIQLPLLLRGVLLMITRVGMLLETIVVKPASRLHLPALGAALVSVASAFGRSTPVTIPTALAAVEWRRPGSVTFGGARAAAKRAGRTTAASLRRYAHCPVAVSATIAVGCSVAVAASEGLRRSLRFNLKMVPIAIRYRFYQWLLRRVSEEERSATFTMLHERHAPEVLAALLDLRARARTPRTRTPRICTTRLHATHLHHTSAHHIAHPNTRPRTAPEHHISRPNTARPQTARSHITCLHTTCPHATRRHTKCPHTTHPHRSSACSLFLPVALWLSVAAARARKLLLLHRAVALGAQVASTSRSARCSRRLATRLCRAVTSMRSRCCRMRCPRSLPPVTAVGIELGESGGCSCLLPGILCPLCTASGRLPVRAPQICAA